MRKPPAEVVASLLAATTVFIGLPPYNLPPWAIFISWAATFAIGGPTFGNMRKLWLTMPIGSIAACSIVIGFKWSGQFLIGGGAIAAQCVILFCLNGLMMSLGRFRPINFVPGMFFGFATYFATLFGGFGPAAGNLLVALVACITMNALGPIYAWLTANLSTHHHQREAEPPAVDQRPVAPNGTVVSE
ncbi:MAG: DUF1097 domain-containing protein [Candidimonas sp.]|nr:MAG: DUF1097 domain-containing protein [Candidimonas sp.]